ncbi:MAG TPA: tetratricopeptide repeat protein [Longimicrobiales bacterium]
MAEAHQDEIAKLEALYVSNPEGRVFTHLAEAYRKAGDRERAHEILTDGLRRHPDSASAYVVLGRVLADGGETEESIAAFRQALERDAGNLVALRWLGDLTVKAGRVDEAIGFYHELIARDPSDVNLLDRVSMLEADRAAAMSAPPATDHPAEPVELPPEIESPSGIRESASGLADIEALAADDSVETEELVPGSDDVLAALAASQRRADPLESLAYDPIENPARHADASQSGELELSVEHIAEETPPAESAYAMDLDESPEAPAFELSVDDIAPEDPAAEMAGAEVMELSIEDMVAPAMEDSGDEFMPDASLSLSEPQLDVGGFSDAVGGEAPDISEAAGATPAPPRAPVTETMAELYRNQGFPERAAEVYRQLLRERGSDERIERLLAEIDLEQGGVGDSSPDAALFKQDASGELWLQEVESPWFSSAQDGDLQDTPYAWSDNGEEAGSGAPAIASYFESLLGWRPRSADEAMLLLGDDDAVTEIGAATRFMDAPEDSGYFAPADTTAAAHADEAQAEAVAEAVSTGDPWEDADRDMITGTGFGAEEADTTAAVDPGALDRDTFDTAVDQPAADPFDRLIEAFELPDPPEAVPPQAPPAASAPAAPASAAEDDLMPWETAPSSFGPPATPVRPAEDAMPWETLTQDIAPPPAAPAPPAADDLMPWETAPAAAATPPEASPAFSAADQVAADVPPPWSAADELLPGTGTQNSDWSMGHAGAALPGAGAAQSPEEEDDEDLEMFRSWLQSLKK